MMLRLYYRVSFSLLFTVEYLKEFVAKKNGRRYRYYIIRDSENYFRIYSVQKCKCVFRPNVLYSSAWKYLDRWLRGWADEVIEKPF